MGGKRRHVGLRLDSRGADLDDVRVHRLLPGRRLRVHAVVRDGGGGLVAHGAGNRRFAGSGAGIMTRMALLSFSCIALLASSCADRSQEQDLKPPPGFVPPPASPPKKLPLGPRIRHGEGFYPTE